MFYYTITIDSLGRNPSDIYGIVTLLFEYDAENIIPATNTTFTFQSKETFETWSNILRERLIGIVFYFAQVIDNKSDITNFDNLPEILKNVEIVRSVVEQKKH